MWVIGVANFKATIAVVRAVVQLYFFSVSSIGYFRLCLIRTLRNALLAASVSWCASAWLALLHV